MARPRKAKSEEIERRCGAALQRILAAVRSPKAHPAVKNLKKHLVAVQKRTGLSKVPLRTLLVPDKRKIREQSKTTNVTTQELEALVGPLEWIADIAEGKPITRPERPEIWFTTLARLSQRPAAAPAQRFKSAFEEAFRLRTEAARSGNVITAAKLAQRLTRYEFKRNPESAVRAMQRGVARVREEHERCVEQGVKSPFLAEEGSKRPRT